MLDTMKQSESDFCGEALNATEGGSLKITVYCKQTNWHNCLDQGALIRAHFHSSIVRRIVSFFVTQFFSKTLF